MSVMKCIQAIIAERFAVSVSYDIVGNDTARVTVIDLSEGDEYVQEVPNLKPFLVKADRSLRIAWGETDDFDIIFLYNPDDDNFCYAVNLQVPDFSEFGYAPV
jgi:hypothetical protein